MSINKQQKIAIIGGSGFAKEVIEVAEMLGHKIYGVFADKPNNIGYEYKGYLDELLALKDEFDVAHIAIGAVNKEGISVRATMIDFLTQNNIPTISLISPRAFVSQGAQIGDGVYIGHSVIISIGSQVGNYVVLNHHADIGHDAIIGVNVSIAPQVFVGGGTKIANHVMIGVASTLRQGIEIGEFSVVGMKSSVIKSLKPNSFVFTLPSKISVNKNSS